MGLTFLIVGGAAALLLGALAPLRHHLSTAFVTTIQDWQDTRGTQLTEPRELPERNACRGPWKRLQASTVKASRVPAAPPLIWACQHRERPTRRCAGKLRPVRAWWPPNRTKASTIPISMMPGPIPCQTGR